jgi:hypothetical protein
MDLIGKIIITTNTLYPKQRKQSKQITQTLMLPSTKTVRQNNLSAMVNSPPAKTNTDALYHG